jgi:hypothetical protein
MLPKSSSMYLSGDSKLYSLSGRVEEFSEVASGKVIYKEILHLLLPAQLRYAALSLPNGAELHSLSPPHLTRRG